MQLKMFVLVRQDLDLAYRHVQGIHALAAYFLKYKSLAQMWANKTLVCLSVVDESQLKRWCRKLDQKGISFADFHEPDLDNQLTAIAVATNKNIFNELDLMN